MKTLLITQARLGSSRLPGKVLKKIKSKTLLQIHLERLTTSKEVSQIVVATTDKQEDEQISNLVKQLGFSVYRGSENDVLDRFYQAARPYAPDLVVRVTSDCPLIDASLVDEVIRFGKSHDAEYCSNNLVENFPDGQDVEVFEFKALETAWNEANLMSDREHVTPYIRRNSTHFGGKKFKSINYPAPEDYSRIRMTVDEPKDFELISVIIKNQGLDKSWREYTQYMIDHELTKINNGIVRNEGYLKSLNNDNTKMKNRYTKSENMLSRALKTVPLGSQTFSKSKTQLPYGVSPYFASRGEGAYLYDVDDNKYIDFVNSLASITLGYNDPDVIQAVRLQLEKGTIFSLANELEFTVAEKIVKMVPCAEMVRFGKNGSDATAGAVRIARAHTKKDHVLVCGYHGWQDWYIGSTGRNLGVPKNTRELTHAFVYNDIESLTRLFDEYNDQVAAVVMEPVNVSAPKDNFLQKVKEITHQNKAVLVFDETVTGFRFSNGGAQEFFNVIPDLACFGKGLANGYPVSAVAGKAELMKLMEEVFFSFTFGGELLSLAAANATLDKLEKEPVISSINKVGSALMDGLRQLIHKYEFESIFSIEGYPVWSFFVVKDTKWATSWEIKTLFLQEMFRRGIFIIGSHNMSYAHTLEHVKITLAAYNEFFLVMQKAQKANNINLFIEGKTLEPLFKLR
jgi:glutamate-1-semialdehyde aminotransferase/spore coat polysaccharide biosynthesis protein SpsF (cytidylyltransferase family)